jgi:methionyl-tRNA formyltransferase
MLSRCVVPIAPTHTAADLHDLLAQAGGELIVQTLALAERGPLVGTPQPEEGVNYAAKLDKAESLLDWQAPAELLARRVRAFNPVPGASLRLAGLDDPVKVWRASALPATEASSSATPGAILRADAEGIDVATADGVLRLLELQKAGGKRQPVEIFVRGWSAPATC